MTEISSLFKTLPISLCNEILEWATQKHIWHTWIDESTGKMVYRHNVRLHIEKIIMHRSPLLLFTSIRGNHWIERSKQVSIFIEGEEIPAIEICYNIAWDRHTGYDYPDIYIEYQRNNQMEYIHTSGSTDGNDPTNPETFHTSKLYRMNPDSGKYVMHQIEIDHAYEVQDYTRKVSVIDEDLTFLHESFALYLEFERRRATDRCAYNKMLIEMSDAQRELHKTGKCSACMINSNELRSMESHECFGDSLVKEKKGIYQCATYKLNKYGMCVYSGKVSQDHDEASAGSEKYSGCEAAGIPYNSGEHSSTEFEDNTDKHSGSETSGIYGCVYDKLNRARSMIGFSYNPYLEIYER